MKCSKRLSPGQERTDKLELVFLRPGGKPGKTMQFKKKKKKLFNFEVFPPEGRKNMSLIP